MLSGSTIPRTSAVAREIRDYQLCKYVYRCSPLDIQDVPEWKLELHYSLRQESRNDVEFKKQRDKNLERLRKG